MDKVKVRVWVRVVVLVLSASACLPIVGSSIRSPWPVVERYDTNCSYM